MALYGETSPSLTLIVIIPYQARAEWLYNPHSWVKSIWTTSTCYDSFTMVHKYMYHIPWLKYTSQGHDTHTHHKYMVYQLTHKHWITITMGSN